MSEEKRTTSVRPFWGSCSQSVEEGNACVEIEIPGVKKEDIDLSVSDDGFSLKAPAGDVKYSGAWTWACPVDSSKVKAKYNNGLLSITAPVKPGPSLKTISIE
jgi:HSP20 family molecular chaperone IbpA